MILYRSHILSTLGLLAVTTAGHGVAQVSPHGKSPGFSAVFLASKEQVIKAYGKPVSDTGTYDTVNTDSEPGHTGESLFFDDVAGAKRIEVHLFDGKATCLTAVYKVNPTPEQLKALLGAKAPIVVREYLNPSHIPEDQWQTMLSRLKNKGIFTGTPKELVIDPTDSHLFPQAVPNTSHAVYRVDKITDPEHAKMFAVEAGDVWVQVQFNFSKV